MRFEIRQLNSKTYNAVGFYIYDTVLEITVCDFYFRDIHGDLHDHPYASTWALAIVDHLNGKHIKEMLENHEL
jgi:hypothetical protein